MSFVLRATVPRSEWERMSDVFLKSAMSRGFLGLSEGGVEGDAIDSDLPPAGRDWILEKQSAAGVCEVELFFANESGARWAEQGVLPSAIRSTVEPVVARDWDAEWKKSFKGVRVDDFWSVLPPWEAAGAAAMGEHNNIVINPGAGFGTGTHETTQMCLKFLKRLGVNGSRVLDFGSGSGILSIASKLLGAAHVQSIEIDPLAVSNAEENAQLNGVEVQVHTQLEPTHTSYSVVVANILRPVLIEHSVELTGRFSPREGHASGIVLSGLLHAQVDEVASCYVSLLARKWGVADVEISRQGDWSAVLILPMCR